MKHTNIFAIALTAMVLVIPSAIAQNSLPAPGSGGGFRPAPGGFGPGPGMMRPTPPPPMRPVWGGGWNSTPSIVINANFGDPADSNSGYENVMACGYDAQGIWRVLPLYVNYVWNGAQYDVTVVNAWNPWTQMWSRGIDMPAYNTSYYLRGNNYDFYAPLSTGTYYFNL